MSPLADRNILADQALTAFSAFPDDALKRISPDEIKKEGRVPKNGSLFFTIFQTFMSGSDEEGMAAPNFMDLIDQGEKTLVFCATQLHALAVRDLVNQLKRSKNPDYCHRVTANDGKNGERHLDMFKDNEKSIPTILTTSQKLSTGVDARNVRNIVLMRPINSMIEFKQIIGRGTRLFDGKDYFTIYDFVKAYEHFNDPEWDGEPVEPVVVDPRPDPDPDDSTLEPDPPDDGDGVEGEGDDAPKPKRIVIKLSDGKARAIQKMTRTMFWGADGKPLSSEEFMRGLYGELPTLFQDEEELREIWGDPATRRRLLLGLSERGYGREQLLDLARLIDAEGSDLYDVLAYVAYAREPISRADRVDRQRDQILAGYSDKQREFLEFILDQYVKEGVDELDDEKLPDLLELKYHSVHDALPVLGPVQDIRNAFVRFQPHLYAD